MFIQHWIKIGCRRFWQIRKSVTVYWRSSEMFVARAIESLIENVKAVCWGVSDYHLISLISIHTKSVSICHCWTFALNESDSFEKYLVSNDVEHFNEHRLECRSKCWFGYYLFMFLSSWLTWPVSTIDEVSFVKLGILNDVVFCCVALEFSSFACKKTISYMIFKCEFQCKSEIFVQLTTWAVFYSIFFLFVSVVVEWGIATHVRNYRAFKVMTCY